MFIKNSYLRYYFCLDAQISLHRWPNRAKGGKGGNGVGEEERGECGQKLENIGKSGKM